MKAKTQIKLDMPSSAPKKVEQGIKVVAMSKVAMPGDQPLITALSTATDKLGTLLENAKTARQASLQASAAVQEAVKIHLLSYTNLANHVATTSNGNATFILSTGYGVRATPTPVPSPGAPTHLRVKMGTDPGSIQAIWKAIIGAKVYNVQYTTDPTGADAWIDADSTPSAARLLLTGLESGTTYLIRVCALGNGLPGPFTTPVQQMAP